MRNKPELKEQARYICWAKEQGIEPYGIPASTYTTSWSALNDNKRAGVRKGLPDTITLIPASKSKSGQPIIVFIEFKRADGKGILSKEQKFFIDFIQSVKGSTYSYVAHGFEAAKEYLESKLRVKSQAEKDAEYQAWLVNNNIKA